MRPMSLLLLAGCSAIVTTAAAPAQETSGNPMALLIERYETDRDALRRVHGVPMSPRRGERMNRFNEDSLKELGRVDFEALGVEGRIDHVLLRTHLARERRHLALEAKKDGEIAALVPFRETIAGLEESRRRMETVDPAKAADRLTALAKEVAEARKGAEKADRVAARRAAQRVFALRETLRGWYRFYAGYHPEFTWWAQKPYEKAEKELEGYGAHLRDKVAKENEPGAAGLVGDPIGRDALLGELADEMIAYTPEELIARAEKEFAWCEERLREASRELGCGDDVKKALEKVKGEHVPPGKQPDLVRDYAQAAVKFLEERDLVTIPDLAKEVWRMEMMPPERQKVTPYFTGGEVVSVSFPTHDMDHEQKLMSLRGNNVHFCWATVHHELIPGHHLQGFMAARHRTHRRLFRTPFLVEGWALYWELLLWDLGFARSPGDKVGMLFWRMHRAARIIVSLKFHLGKMAPVEMTDFLVDRVGHERDGATAEV
ncbi:MAG TPA: DUF885 family protein, partial [Planctomycetota bacterium]|nr:DUF885 family protein [Planctomycetota bacterium]